MVNEISPEHSTAVWNAQTSDFTPINFPARAKDVQDILRICEFIIDSIWFSKLL